MDIQDKVLVRDAATFRMIQGKLYLASKINGRRRVLLFEGQGLFTMTPPTQVEKDQLLRIYGRPAITKPFSSLFLFVVDTASENNILGLGNSWTAIKDPHANKILNLYSNYILDQEKKFVSSDMGFLLDAVGNESPCFFAGFSEKSNILQSGHVSGSSMDDPMFFKMSDEEVEEIQLYRRGSSQKYWLEPVSAFHKSSYYDTPSYFREQNNDRLRVNHYSIQLAFDSKARVRGRASMDIQFIRDNIQTFSFLLYYKIRVDSVLISGVPVDFIKPVAESVLWDDSWDREKLWIRLPKPSTVSEIYSVDVFYSGEIFERIRDDFYMRSSLTWYPYYFTGRRSTSTFDITYSYPSDFKIASVGTKISEFSHERQTTSRWALDYPCAGASFGFGFLKSFEYKRPNLPQITILIDEKEAGGLFAGQGYKEEVASEVANAVSFFQDIFGPLPFNSMTAVEIPYSHGEAFPGLIHMPWWTLRGSDDSGINESFRAHEVAHQWWGIGVGYKTYHDQWLSEAFAEYSGLWYMQFILHDNKKFFRFLREYRDAIVKNRNSFMDKLAGLDQQAGPVWLGYRTSSRSTRGDYDLVVYRKGAWVLHMLRNLMLDLNTMNDEPFKRMMRDFYQTYAGTSVETKQFQQVVEKHMGADMTWFFDQWVYGVDVPKYTVRYKVDNVLKDNNASQPRYKVTYRISQKNVPPAFEMFIPILIDFGNNQIARMRVHAKGPDTEIVLPLLPLKPKSIQFNYLESVLCEYEEKGW